MTEVAVQTDAEPLLAAMPRPRHRWLRLVLLLAAAATTFLVVYFTYMCPAGWCGGGGLAASLAALPPPPADTVSYDQLRAGSAAPFDLAARDTMVFLHIQKTGGTEFGRHLVHDLQLPRPCVCHRKQKRCECLRPSGVGYWLFSRYSTGWRCGLHADWTELTACVPHAMDQLERDTSRRRYFYIALLREPIQRYLSEWKHVRRGATWSTSRHWCGGREATEGEIPSCYAGEDWSGVTLNEFTACESNLASNRQTRMLADLTVVQCYADGALPAAERDRRLLESAKTNLRRLAWFGLTEQQRRAQYTFERQFGLRFGAPFAGSNDTHAESALRQLRPGQLAAVRRRNALDIELYEFARRLLERRFRAAREADPQFGRHWAALGRAGRADDSRELERR